MVIGKRHERSGCRDANGKGDYKRPREWERATREGKSGTLRRRVNEEGRRKELGVGSWELGVGVCTTSLQ